MYASRGDSFSEYFTRPHSSATGSPCSISADNDGLDDGRGAKRTPKACDRCRHKKTKCTGETPCQRCKLDNTVCSYTTRRPKEGPNFNPQVAQKDAAMLMLYKCIEVMNQELLTARLGPYSDITLASQAETEEFIIGVILDRFGVNPVLDEFDNQPVYFPGQKGSNAENSAVYFPQFNAFPTVGFEEGLENKHQTPLGTRSALSKAMCLSSRFTEATMQISEDNEAQVPRRKKRRTSQERESASPTPELEHTHGYASPPDLFAPETPRLRSSIPHIDDQFSDKGLGLRTGSPPQHSFTSGQQQSYIGLALDQPIPCQHNILKSHPLALQNFDQSSLWGSLETFNELSVGLLSGEGRGIESFLGAPREFTASPSAGPTHQYNHQRSSPNSVFYLRRKYATHSSPVAPPYHLQSKQSIPAPPQIAQATEMQQAGITWDLDSATRGMQSYSTPLGISGVSPEISSLNLTSAGAGSGLRNTAEVADSSAYAGGTDYTAIGTGTLPW